MKMHKVSLLAAVLLFTAGAVSAQQAAQDAAPQAQPRVLALEAAQDYLEKSRYPDHSKALPAGTIDPLRDERTAHPITVRDGEKIGASMSVWSAEVSYRPGETMAFFAAPTGFDAASVTGVIADAAGSFATKLVFHDDGQGVDEQAGDGIYSADFRPTRRLVPDLAQAYRVTVDAARVDGHLLTATTGFLLSNPWADLTGEYRDSVVDGNLLIEAKVEVRRQGRFHISGVLHTLDGEAIGTAQAARRLEPGVHWLPLEFYGLMMHDRQVRGPVKLGSVTLTTTGGMPNAMGAVITDAHVVKRMEKATFRNVPYGHAGDLEAARRLEADGLRTLKARGER